MKKIFLLVLVLGFGISFTGCKSKKAYSDSLRTKNVLAEHQKSKSDYTAPKSNKDTSLPHDTGKFERFEINDISDYIATFAEVAQREMKAYGIPASIKLAQGLLESGYGQGELAQKTNNHFGIKCHTGWEGDYDFHDDDEKGECFRKYNHPMYSYRDHSIFLTTRSRYAFLFDYDTTDYKSWAKGLRKAGYATDKKYPQKLIYLIEKHRLYEYDGDVPKSVYAKNKPVVAENNAVHTVKKGDTLYSLSKRYFVSIEELMRLNRLRNANLSVGQKLMVKSTEINK
ncbi:glucosaminidase domain-containing protein [Maribacter chungangensis]|uniref:Peptidoglycan hydrolase n=1 Tax=Maribacter chungangensis TaxID=1069117 RepID=A0ABW3B5T5_9FLAO